jgi:hypothetical protein
MTFHPTFQNAANDLANGSLEIRLSIGEHVVMNDQFWGVFCGSIGRKMMIRAIGLALAACP